MSYYRKSWLWILDDWCHLWLVTIYHIVTTQVPVSTPPPSKITQINRQAVIQFLNNLLKNWTDLICPQNVYFYPVRKTILA